MRIWVTVAFAAMVASEAAAQTPQAGPPLIRVVGHGQVETPPDVAKIEYTLRGEGRSSDDAARQLAARREATDAVLAGKAEVRTGKLAIVEARDKACDGGDEDDYDAKSRLSTGVCAVVGYIATLSVTARVTPIGDAGTLAGLIGRAGGINPRVSDFDLRDPRPAQRSATAAAIADAQRQAEAIAAASGAKLGMLRRVEDQRTARDAGQDIVVTAQRSVPSLAMPTPPVILNLTPEPVETDANLVVEFEIAAP